LELGLRLLAAIRQAVNPPAASSKFAVIAYGDIAIALFTSGEDAEYALASQLDLKAGILAKVWVHHPTIPRPQYQVHTELEVMEVPGCSPKATHDKVKRECGEIGFIRFIKAPIDDRTEEEKDFDSDEETQLGIGPRKPRQYHIYFRQSAGQRCAEELNKRPISASLVIYRCQFKVYRGFQCRRLYLEKPLDKVQATTTQYRRSRAAAPGYIDSNQLTLFSQPAIKFTTVQYHPLDWIAVLAQVASESDRQVLLSAQASMPPPPPPRALRRGRHLVDDDDEDEVTAKRSRH